MLNFAVIKGCLGIFKMNLDLAKAVYVSIVVKMLRQIFDGIYEKFCHYACETNRFMKLFKIKHSMYQNEHVHYFDCETHFRFLLFKMNPDFQEEFLKFVCSMDFASKIDLNYMKY